MKKQSKALSLFLSLCMLLSVFSTMVYAEEEIIETNTKADTVGASSGTCGDSLAWTLDDEGTLTISGTGTMTDYGTQQDYGNIIDAAPWGTGVKKLIAENGITSIGDYAFYGCESLASIEIPESITRIGCYAFYDTAYYNDDSNWGGFYEDTLYIGKYLIEQSSWLATSAINDGTELIADWAFRGSEIDYITIPDSVKYIGKKAFNCDYLESIKIPDSVISIGEHSFGYSWFGEKIENFTIYGVKGTVAETYAAENSISFKEIEKINGMYGENLNWTLDIDGTLTISGTGDMMDFGYNDDSWPLRHHRGDIKTVIIDEGITSVGSNAFSECTSISSITIPDSVVSIGDSAFYLCASLVNINIPDSVTSIGYDAFWGTGYYNTESNWENGALYLGKYLIEASETIENCEIKEGTKFISDSAFFYCESLSSITIPDSVTHIGEMTVGYAYGEKIENFTIKGVKGSAAETYATESGFTFVDINSDSPDDPEIDVPEIKASGTCGENLTWTLDINGTLTISGTGNMENYTYSNSSPWDSFVDDIKTVIINKGVTSIGDYAFYDCTSLLNVTIPDSVTSIGDRAFCGCDYLVNVTIPNSVTSIGYGAFSYCYSLVSVTIPDSVTSIGDSAFYDCNSLVNVTIPDSVTNIGASSFQGCDSLVNVTIPNSVTSIGDYAFYDCTSLLNVTIPDSVTSIGDRAFCGCDSLVNVTIPNSVTSIGDVAFYDCTSLLNVTIPDSVTSIGDRAFCGCESLSEINVSEDNPMYSSENGVLFNKDKTAIICYPAGKKDSSYTIPNSVTNIEECAFSYCYSLVSVTIPNSVTSIGDGAFCGCDSLVNVTIPDSVTNIGASSFQGCDSLVNVTIPNSVTSIKDHAFSFCYSLVNVTIPDSVTSIGDSSFYDCYSLVNVTIPDSVTSIGSKAFGYYYSFPAYEKKENFTIKGVKGSAAETYATENGFTFVALDITTLPKNDYYINKDSSTMPNVIANTTASTIISKLSEYDIKVTITDKNGNALADTAKVGTGCKVTDNNGNVYTVIVNGDIDGTGEVNATDYLQIKKMFLGALNVENEYFIAADTDGDGAITSTDYLQIKKYFLGTLDLYA